jgi:hypothetical protein
MERVRQTGKPRLNLGSGGGGKRRKRAEPEFTGRAEGDSIIWSSSKLDWLEGRGERLCLIEMIDTRTERLFARFVLHNSSVENLEVLKAYIDRYGRPRKVWTRQSSHFIPLRQKNHPARSGPLPLTRIGYVLQELGVAWSSEIPAKTRIRISSVLKRRRLQILRGLRLAGAKSLEDANVFLESEFLAKPVSPGPPGLPGEHPVLQIEPFLAEPRLLGKNCTFRFNGTVYRVMDPPPSQAGAVRIDVRPLSDGQIVAEINGRRVTLAACSPGRKGESERPQRKRSPRKQRVRPRVRWMDGFWLKRALTLEQAIAVSNATY